MDNSKYLSKARDSFDTKLNLYIFSQYILKENSDLINLSNFKQFVITEDLVNVYSTKYWNWEENVDFDKIPSSFKFEIKTNLTISELYKKMKEWKINNQTLITNFKNDYVANFEDVFKREEFDKLLLDNECEYCGITIDKVDKLVKQEQLFNKQPFRGYVLEIDRLNSNYEYTKKNSVMCCYWCNNAKTDEFTYKEFKVIGKAISKIWQERLTIKNKMI